MGSRTPVGAGVVVALLSTFVLLTGCASNPHAVADHRARRDHYAVAPDTLSLEAFLALSEGPRAARREMASDLRQSSEMLRYQQRRVEDMRWDWTMVNRYRPAGGWYSVARVLADLRQAALWDPTDIGSLTLLAELEIREGQHARGRAHLAVAWQALEACGEPRLSRRRADVIALAAWSCREEGLVDDARSWLARGRLAAPGDPELALLEGLVLVEEGQTLAATAVAARLSPVSYFEIVNSTGWVHRERNETGVPSRWLRAMALWRDGRADLAWHALQPLRWDQAYLPYANRFWQDVGLIAETAGRPEAAQAYARARHSHPFRTGIVSQAFAGPPSVLDLPQKSLPFIVGCAGNYAGGSLFAYACKAAFVYFEDPGDASAPQALTHARNVLAICRRRGIHPDHARAMLGRLEYVAGRHDVAEKDLLAASAAFAKLGKVDGTTEWLLGLVRLEAEDPVVASTRLAAAVAADPTLGLAWSTLGAAQAALGDSASARVSMDRSVELRPRNSSVWFNRGLLRARGGDLTGARADLEVAARLSSQYAEVAALLQRITWAQRNGLAALPSPPAGSSPIVMLAEPGRDTASELVVDRRLLMRQYLAELDEAFSPAAPGVPAAVAGLGSLETAYAASPDPALRQRLALVYLCLSRYEDARAMLGDIAVADLGRDERIMLLYADSRLGRQDLARQLTHELAAGHAFVPDRYTWALVAATAVVARPQESSGVDDGAGEAVDRDLADISKWMEEGFWESRPRGDANGRGEPVPPSLTRLNLAAEAGDEAVRKEPQH